MSIHRTTIRTQIFALGLLFLLASLAQAQDTAKKLDLNGLWNANKPEGVVKVTQAGSSVRGTFVSGGKCPFGAPPITTYFEGQLRDFSPDGTASLDGTVYFCTSAKVLSDCGFRNWSTKIHGIARETTIDLTYTSENYNLGASNSEDEKCPSKPVRDPTGDSERNFSLNRNNCADVKKQLEAASIKSPVDLVRKCGELTDKLLECKEDNAQYCKQAPGPSECSPPNVKYKGEIACDCDGNGQDENKKVFESCGPPDANHKLNFHSRCEDWILGEGFGYSADRTIARAGSDYLALLNKTCPAIDCHRDHQKCFSLAADKYSKCTFNGLTFVFGNCLSNQFHANNECDKKRDQCLKELPKGWPQPSPMPAPTPSPH